MAEPIFTAGRVIIAFADIFVVAGSFIADYSETHVFNKHWPPHARFHNGQTMSLSVLLGAASIYFAFRPSLPNNTISAKESAFVAAVIGSLYCFAGLTAILYPGTNWWDKEYPNNGEQRYIFSGVIALQVLGYALEAQRLSGGDLKGKMA